MEIQYVEYCHPGNPYYDQPAAATATDLPAVTRELPEHWTRHADREWVYLVPGEHHTPLQGWKVHVSATLDNAERLLATVWDYCTANNIMFKFIRGLGVLGRRNSKYGDRSSSGKFITIYPADEAALETVLRELGDALDGEKGPYILSDLRWRSGPLYVRYGGFASRTVRRPNGELVYCIEAPDGQLVPDERRPSFRPPAWVQIPQCLQDALAARGAGTLKNFPYKPNRALHFSNGGGVYVATNTETGESVLLKEARPLAGLDEIGRDAVGRLERERWALQTLAGVDGIPRLIDYRIGHEHYFLVREFVDATPLTHEVQRRNPLLNPDLPAEDAAEYTKWAYGILDRVERGVRAMHDRGVVFGDLHPNNILVREDGSISFIDLETASAVDAEVGQTIGAPGYRAPAHYRGPAVDEYALGCLRLSMFVPLTVSLPWGPEKVSELIDVVTGFFPVPGDFGDRVWAELGERPYEAVPEPRRAAQAAPVWPVLDATTWPPLRAQFIESLLASATPQRSDRLYPGDIRQFRTAAGGVTFANGAAGVLWSLAQLGTPPPEEHVDWLVAATERIDEPRVGFFDGLPGIAYALTRLGRTELAAEVLDRACALPRTEADLTLYSGLSGLGLTLLEFGRSHADQSYLQAATSVADDIVGRGPDAPSAGPVPGLLTGASGVALFLVRLFEATGERRYLDRARYAVRQDLTRLGWSVPGDANPGDGGPRPTVTPDGWRTPILSAGAGTSVVAHELTRHVDDEDLARARDALAARLSMRFMIHAGVIRGRAGTMIALRHIMPGADDAMAQHAASMGWHVIRVAGRPAVFGDNSLRLSMDYGTGLAGVLLALETAVTPGPDAFPFFGTHPSP